MSIVDTLPQVKAGVEEEVTVTIPVRDVFLGLGFAHALIENSRETFIINNLNKLVEGKPVSSVDAIKAQNELFDFASKQVVSILSSICLEASGDVNDIVIDDDEFEQASRNIQEVLSQTTDFGKKNPFSEEAYNEDAKDHPVYGGAYL